MTNINEALSKMEQNIAEIQEMPDEEGYKISWEGKETYITRSCEYCGKEFKYSLWEYRYDEPRFCNKKKCQERAKIFQNTSIVHNKAENILPKKYIETNTPYEDQLEIYYDRSVFITGSVGVGKTVFMASMIKKYIGNDIPCRWILYPDLTMELQNAYTTAGKDGGTPREIIHNAASFEGVLALDDLGVEKQTDFVKNMTYYLINHRDQNGLITLITTNLKASDIALEIDQRIASRIKGMCDTFEMTGNDLRLGKVPF
jgi:DNA replication protein DnaC